MAQLQWSSTCTTSTPRPKKQTIVTRIVNRLARKLKSRKASPLIHKTSTTTLRQWALIEWLCIWKTQFGSSPIAISVERQTQCVGLSVLAPKKSSQLSRKWSKTWTSLQLQPIWITTTHWTIREALATLQGPIIIIILKVITVVQLSRCPRYSS